MFACDAVLLLHDSRFSHSMLEALLMYSRLSCDPGSSARDSAFHLLAQKREANRTSSELEVVLLVVRSCSDLNALY